MKKKEYFKSRSNKQKPCQSETSTNQKTKRSCPQLICFRIGATHRKREFQTFFPSSKGSTDMQKGERHHETKLIALNYAGIFKEIKKVNGKKEIMFEQVHIKQM